MIGLEHYLVLSAILFVLGVYGALSRRNIITILMSVEIMFNAINIAMVALSKFMIPSAVRYLTNANPTTNELAQAMLTGQLFAIFIITVAAAEVVLGLAIVIAIYRDRNTVEVTDLTALQG